MIGEIRAGGGLPGLAPASRLAHARGHRFCRVGPEHLRILVGILLLTRRKQHLAGVIGDEGARILLPVSPDGAG